MSSGVREFRRWKVQAMDSSGVKEISRLKFVGSVVQDIKMFGARELMISGDVKFMSSGVREFRR